MMVSSSLRWAGVKALADGAAGAEDWVAAGSVVAEGGGVCPTASVAPTSRIAGTSSAAPFREARAWKSEADGLAGMSIPSVGDLGVGVSGDWLRWGSCR